jgi:hypothetical protein
MAIATDLTFERPQQHPPPETIRFFYGDKFFYLERSAGHETNGNFGGFRRVYSLSETLFYPMQAMCSWFMA